MIAAVHLHSTASDGDHLPAAAVRAAVDAGAELVALTDHDTTAGLDEAAAAADALGVRLIRGAEVAVEWQGAEVHLLVLGVPPGWEVPGELAAAHWFRVRRVEEWLARAGAVFPGFEAQRARPAWAATEAPYAGVVLTGMLAEARRLGHLTDRRWDLPAFADAYFGPGGALHVPEDPLPPLADAVRALDAGVVVLAHAAHGVPPDRLPALVAAAATAGARGCEVASSWHDPAQRRRVAELAAAAGLVPTAGSDWHGAVKPGVPDPVGDPDPVRFADMVDQLDLG